MDSHRGSEAAVVHVAKRSNGRRARARTFTRRSDEGIELEQPRRRWYGWQIIVADVAAGSVLATMALADDYVVPMSLGLTLYSLAPMGVHLAHGNVKNSFYSLALRVSLPVLGLGLGWSSGCTDELSSEEFCGPGAFIAIAVGGLAAIAIDAALLGWEAAPPKAEATSSKLRVAPLLEVRRRRGLAGVTGRF